MEDDGCGRRQAESCPELLLWRWEELILQLVPTAFSLPMGPEDLFIVPGQDGHTDVPFTASLVRLGPAFTDLYFPS